MSPDDPRHGSPAGRTAHQADNEPLCSACRLAHAEYASNRYRQIAYGRWNPYVDAEPTRQHVRALIAAGMPYRKIAQAAGVNPRRVSALLYGRANQQPTRKIRPDFADALLAVTLEPSRLPSLGAARRLQALFALGHTPGAIAEALGVTYSRVHQLASVVEPIIMRETHDRVAELYDRLSMLTPVASNRYEKQAISRARNQAKAAGWAPPLAWDDDTIDDPKGRPTGYRICSKPGCAGEHRAKGLCKAHYEAQNDPPTTQSRPRPRDLDPLRIERILLGEHTLPCSKHDKAEVCRRWVANGGTLKDLERLTGWKPERYWKIGDAA